MYPLFLKPEIKDYLWGGTKLKSEYGYETDKEITAEAWVLASRKDGNSTVLNGEFAGQTLQNVLEIWGDDAIGKNAVAFPYFPLLIKLIDAQNKLSVQVHPDDEYALKNEGEFGKTEMWYIVDCKKDAKLIYGFNKSVSRDEFERRIKDNTLTEICNTVPVKKGDVFFIESGTLHAIGEGILIAEVQQNSNTTYRVSDYGRLGADGKPRPLHIEKALQVTKTEKPVFPYGDTGEITKYEFGTVRELAKCNLFSSELLCLDGKCNLKENDSFISLLILSGNGRLEYNSDSLEFKKGDSIFVPAGTEIAVTGKAEILLSKI